MPHNDADRLRLLSQVESAARGFSDTFAAGLERRFGDLTTEGDTLFPAMELMFRLTADHLDRLEEAFDQDEEIYWPPLDGETIITRDHARFAQSQGVQSICSIPMRVDGEPKGVITLERSGEAFVDDDIRLLAGF